MTKQSAEPHIGQLVQVTGRGAWPEPMILWSRAPLRRWWATTMEEPRMWVRIRLTGRRWVFDSDWQARDPVRSTS